MANQFHTEGLQWMLEVCFSEEQSVPANFYLGLCSDVAPARTATLSSLTEISSAGGYARQTIASDNTDWTSALSGSVDRKVTALAQQFAASGADFDTANSWFLATSSDDTGVLIMSGPLLQAPLTLPDGSTQDLTPQATVIVANGWHTEGAQWLLEVLFSEEQSVPANFYLGLCSDASLAANTTLTAVSEISATGGYARKTIASDNTDWTSGTSGSNGRKVTALAQEFAASGADFDVASMWFLATTPDDSGVLLASGVLLSAPFTLTDGNTMQVAPVLTLPNV